METTCKAMTQPLDITRCFPEDFVEAVNHLRLADRAFAEMSYVFDDARDGDEKKNIEQCLAFSRKCRELRAAAMQMMADLITDSVQF